MFRSAGADADQRAERNHQLVGWINVQGLAFGMQTRESTAPSAYISASACCISKVVFLETLPAPLSLLSLLLPLLPISTTLDPPPRSHAVTLSADSHLQEERE